MLPGFGDGVLAVSFLGGGYTALLIDDSKRNMVAFGLTYRLVAPGRCERFKLLPDAIRRLQTWELHFDVTES